MSPENGEAPHEEVLFATSILLVTLSLTFTTEAQTGPTATWLVEGAGPGHDLNGPTRPAGHKSLRSSTCFIQSRQNTRSAIISAFFIPSRCTVNQASLCLDP